MSEAATPPALPRPTAVVTEQHNPASPPDSRRRSESGLPKKKRGGPRPNCGGRQNPPGGRPFRQITPDHLRQIEILAGYGLTDLAIANVIGIGKMTLLRRKKGDALVAEAIARGKAKAEGVVGKALFRKAKSGDVAAIKWWEMTRAGRSEKATTETSVSGTVAVTITRRVVYPEGANARGVEWAAVGEN